MVFQETSMLKRRTGRLWIVDGFATTIFSLTFSTVDNEGKGAKENGKNTLVCGASHRCATGR